MIYSTSIRAWLLFVLLFVPQHALLTTISMLTVSARLPCTDTYAALDSELRVIITA